MILKPASTRSSATSWADAAARPARRRRCLLPHHLARGCRRAHFQVADLLADLLRVDVEHRHDPKAVVGKDVGARDRLPEVACAEERDVVLVGRAQDLADLRDERVDVVADTSLAELPEARQVAPDLGRVDVRVVGQLLGGDRLLAHLLGLRQHLQVARQARRDAERQPLASAASRRARHPGRGCRRGGSCPHDPRTRWRRPPSSFRSCSLVDAMLERDRRRPRATTGIRSP